MRRCAWIAFGTLVAAWVAVVAAGPARAPAQPGRVPADIEPRAVLSVMTAAADWQLAHPSAHEPWDWTQAAFYTGVMALTRLTDDPATSAPC